MSHVTSVGAVRVEDGQAFVSHRLNQHVESLLGDQSPLKLQMLDQDIGSGGGGWIPHARRPRTSHKNSSGI